MNEVDIPLITELIYNEFGLLLDVVTNDDKDKRLSITFRDNKIPRGESYYLIIEASTARFSVEIGFETLAKSLLELSILNMKSNINQINSYLNKVDLRDVSIIINESKIKNFSEIQDYISDLKIEAFSKPVDISNQDVCKEELLKFIMKIFPLVMLVFPYKENYYGDIEGNSIQVKLNRYERSKKNRAICIAYYEAKCYICGLMMENKYGPVAKGYIHVHHKEPISEAGIKNIDPINDLIPLCPNCHSVVHLSSPPMNVDEVKRIIEKGGIIEKI